MRLSEIPHGEKVFIDANIFLYSAFDHPTFGEPCKAFLDKADEGKVTGYSSELVVNEVFHKLTIAEAASKLGVDAKKAAATIKRRPEVLGDLERTWVEMELINSMGISVLSGIPFPRFVELSRQHLLMAADAAHLATMEASGIDSIATKDRDFERVRGLKIWKP